MRKRSYILLLTLFFLTFWAAPRVRADSEKSKEYQIKAAFLYNFIKFIDWPKEKPSDEKTITIGIIGKNPFGKAFEPLKDKEAKNRKILIKLFESVEESKLSDKQIEALRKCHVLFICRSEAERFRKIIDSVKDHSVLTVGDKQDFLEAGGMINFVNEEEKVRFEINNTVARKAKLEIRSKLLRLAKKVIDDQSSNGAQN